ncbi:hypothetical protein AB0L71_13595 [Streptomyces sp. NPDC052052]|uniref:LGFP repeat-containing protein n=1 Tax=Streptomyces sp. NPDC052052 TaxID=3154756 RepID=UPI00343FD4FB
MLFGAVRQRGIRNRTGVGLGALVLLTGLCAAVSPTAHADTKDPYCGHKVVGDIEKRYIEMNGRSGPLGCPLTDELVNPDGFGRRTQFEHGTIYWSPRSGAWPVWGAIGEYWCDQGCERGPIGYPVSYERKVGAEIQQRFQCAVIHFKQTSDTATQTWRDEICV